MNKKIRIYVNWGLPIFLALAVYLLIYISSNFEEEIFSWVVLLFFVSEILLLGYITKLYFKGQQEKHPDKIPSIGNFTIAVLIALIVFLMSYLGLKAFLIWATSQDDAIDLRHITLALTQGVLISLIIVGAEFLLNYMKRLNEIELKSERIQKENSRAKLASLQSQLNPHFLFNNFNTLDGLIAENPQEASRFVNELAKLYRSFLNDDSDKLVSLREELQLVERYNYLIKTRFGDKYHCQINIKSEDWTDFYLPPMAIQILLENVIKHNKIDIESPINCKIDIDGKYLSVTNNKNLKTQIQGSSGIGLTNLKARYKFFSDQEVKVFSADQEFAVHIPLLQIEHCNVTSF